MIHDEFNDGRTEIYDVCHILISSSNYFNNQL